MESDPLVNSLIFTWRSYNGEEKENSQKENNQEETSQKESQKEEEIKLYLFSEQGRLCLCIDGLFSFTDESNSFDCNVG